MIHPLFRLLLSRPQMLAEHVGAYAELASAEAAEAAVVLRTRTLLAVAAVVCGLLGLGLAGVALLLLAALPSTQMPMPWLLALVPLVPLALGLACWQAARRQPPAPAFSLLRRQVALDAALLRAVDEARA